MVSPFIALGDQMIDQSNPQSFATLRLRFETKDGPRTILARNLSVRDASLVAAAVKEAGHYAECQEGGAVYDLADHLIRHRRRRTIKLVRQA